MTVAGNVSLAEVIIGGRRYPHTAVQNCRTCSHPRREEIEKSLIRGATPSSIVQQFGGEHLSPRNVADHLRNGHLPIRDEGVAQYREQVAAERADVVAEGAAQVVTALGFARRVVGTVDARLACGNLVPGVGDGLRAAAVLAPYEQATESQEGYTEEEITAFLLTYLSAVREVCTREQTLLIRSRVEGHPAFLRAQKQVMATSGDQVSQ